MTTSTPRQHRKPAKSKRQLKPGPKPGPKRRPKRGPKRRPDQQLKQPAPPQDLHQRQQWWVYLLLCADDSLYTGCTNDLERRLKAHLRGGIKYTRGRLPVALAYREPAPGKGAALSREAAIKRLSRISKLGLLDSPPL